MESPPAKGVRRRVPKGLLGAIALIVFGEAMVEGAGAHLVMFDQWAFRVSGKMASSKVKDRDVLIFGDSLMKLAVVPNLVESRSGQRTYNLAVSGGQPTSSYFLLRRVIDGGARPKAVFVDFFPRLMALGPDINFQQWPFLLRFDEVADLACESRDARLLGDLAVAKALPSVRCRQALRGMVAAKLAGESGSQFYNSFAGLRNWKLNDGAQIMGNWTERSASSLDFKTWKHEYFADHRWDPVNERYLRRFLDLANRHDITVYWVLPPYIARLQRTVEESGFDAWHRGLVASYQERYRNIVVVDGHRLGYDDRVFFDPHHLGKDGAYLYSLALGDFLRRRAADRDDARWVALPPYRGPKMAAPLEDVIQSAEVLVRRIQVSSEKRTR